MPTASGLPRAGEIWQRVVRLPPDWKSHKTVFRVLERSRGDYWSMRVQILSMNGEPPKPPNNLPRLWVDCAHWFSQGQLKFIRSEKADRGTAIEALIGSGDILQSSASRLAEYVLTLEGVPYEVNAAALEARSALGKWAEARKATN